jgi:hypothetical protein
MKPARSLVLTMLLAFGCGSGPDTALDAIDVIRDSGSLDSVHDDGPDPDDLVPRFDTSPEQDEGKDTDIDQPPIEPAVRFAWAEPVNSYWQSRRGPINWGRRLGWVVELRLDIASVQPIASVEVWANELLLEEETQGTWILDPAAVNSSMAWLRARVTDQEGAVGESMVGVSLAGYCNPGLVIRPDPWESAAAGHTWIRLGSPDQASQYPGAEFVISVDGTEVERVVGDSLDQALDMSHLEPGERILEIRWHRKPGDPRTEICPIRIPIMNEPDLPGAACQARIRGFVSGAYNQLNDISVDVDPPVSGTEVTVLIDGEPVAFGDPSGVILSGLASQLDEGDHLLAAMVRLPDGGTCMDTAGFTWDVTPPVLELAPSLATSNRDIAYTAVKVRDSTFTNVEVSHWGGGEDVFYGCSYKCAHRTDLADDQMVATACMADLGPRLPPATVTIAGIDAAGNRSEVPWSVAVGLERVELLALPRGPDLNPEDWRQIACAECEGDDWIKPLGALCQFSQTDSNSVGPNLFGRSMLLIAALGPFIGADMLAYSRVEVSVDGGEPTGVLGEFRNRPFWYMTTNFEWPVLSWIWDTRDLEDGHHQVDVRVSLMDTSVNVTAGFYTINGFMSGGQVDILQCDTEFAQCALPTTGRVPGPIGVRVDSSRISRTPGSSMSILLDGEVVNTCEEAVCDLLIDWGVPGRANVTVSAKAPVGIKPYATQMIDTSSAVTFWVVDADLDGDGYLGIDDGGDDCDDEDPLVNPGALDPEGPDCAAWGNPQTRQHWTSGLVQAAARDAQGNRHIFRFDPIHKILVHSRYSDVGWGQEDHSDPWSCKGCNVIWARTNGPGGGPLGLVAGPANVALFELGPGHLSLDYVPGITQASQPRPVSISGIPGVLYLDGANLALARRGAQGWEHVLLDTFSKVPATFLVASDGTSAWIGNPSLGISAELEIFSAPWILDEVSRMLLPLQETTSDPDMLILPEGNRIVLRGNMLDFPDTGPSRHLATAIMGADGLPAWVDGRYRLGRTATGSPFITATRNCYDCSENAAMAIRQGDRFTWTGWHTLNPSSVGQFVIPVEAAHGAGEMVLSTDKNSTWISYPCLELLPVDSNCDGVDGTVDLMGGW